MKNIYYKLSFILLLFAHSIAGQQNTCLWDGLGFVNSSERSSNLSVTETFTDHEGNYYTVVTFRTSATVGDSTFTTPNENGRLRDVFMAKYSPDGNLIWAKRENLGAGRLHAAVDSDNFIYAAGNITNFDNMMGDSILDDNNGVIFFAKYNSDLEIQTFQQIATNYGEAVDIALDQFGNRYISFFVGITGGSPSISFPDTTYTSSGVTSELFIVKYNNLGEYKWSRKFRAKNVFNAKLATDSAGNLFFAGTYSDSLIIFNQKLYVNSANNYHFFISKIDTSGTLAWLKEYGGDYQDYCYDLFINKNGEALIAGGLGSSSITFGDTTFSKFQGVFDPFFAKFDNRSGNVKWVVKEEAGLSTNAVGKAIFEDKEGNIFFGGRYRGSEVMFGDTVVRGPQTFDAIFVNQYNTNGYFKYFYTTTGNCDDDIISLTVVNNKLVTTGYYNCDIVFCRDTFKKATEFINVRNIFITNLEIISTTATSNLEHKINPVRVFPNPTHDWLHLRFPTEFSTKTITLELFNIQGQCILTKMITGENNFELPVHTLSPGLYALRIRQEGFLQTSRLVIK